MRRNVYPVMNEIKKCDKYGNMHGNSGGFTVKCRHTAETGGFLRQLSDERKVFSLERNEVDKAGCSLHDSSFTLHGHAGFCRGD